MLSNEYGLVASGRKHCRIFRTGDS
jgi:hypothetical protein